MNVYLILFIFLFRGVNLFADVTFNGDFTFSKDNYEKYFFSIELSTKEYYLTTSYKSYSSDFLYSRKEFGSNFGYDNSVFNLSAVLGYVPEVDGYSSYSVGFDFSSSLLNKNVLSIKAGFSFNHTVSKDSYLVALTTHTSSRKPKSNSYSLIDEYEIEENEVGLYLDLEYKDCGLSLSYFDKNYNSLDSSKRKVQSFVTESFVTSGYIDRVYSMNFSAKILKDLDFRIEYSVSDYLYSDDNLVSFGLGFTRYFNSFSFGINYERIKDYYYNDMFNLYGLSASIYFKKL